MRCYLRKRKSECGEGKIAILKGSRHYVVDCPSEFHKTGRACKVGPAFLEELFLRVAHAVAKVMAPVRAEAEVTILFIFE